MDMTTGNPFNAIVMHCYLIIGHNHRSAIPASTVCINWITHRGDFNKFTLIKNMHTNFITNLVNRRFVDDSFGFVVAPTLQVLLFAIITATLRNIKDVVFHSRQYIRGGK